MFSYFYTRNIHLVLWCFFRSKRISFCSADIVLQTELIGIQCCCLWLVVISIYSMFLPKNKH